MVKLVKEKRPEVMERYTDKELIEIIQKTLAI